MKRIIVLAVVAAFLLCGIAVFADGSDYETAIDASKETYACGESFFVKAAISKINTENGIIGFSMCIEYDAEYLKLTEISEDAYSEIHIPEAWSDGEKGENVLEGKIIVYYIANLESENLPDLAVKTDEIFVNVKFECIKETSSTVIKINGSDTSNRCTSIDSDYNVTDCVGKGSETTVAIGENTEISDLEPEPQVDNGNKTIYYIIGGIAVAACIVVVIVIIKKRK